MEKILIGVFSDTSLYKERFDELETHGWDVHLFDAKLEQKEEHLEIMLEFINHYYNKEIKPFFISDIQEFISYVREEFYTRVAAIVWCVEEVNRIVHSDNGKNIYLLTSDPIKVLYQITHSHGTYLYLDMDNPYKAETYIAVYCKQLHQRYKCNMDLVISIMLLDELFEEEQSFSTVNSILNKIIVEPNGEVIELIEQVLPHYSITIQVSLIMALYKKTNDKAYLHRCFKVAEKLPIKQAVGLMWTIKRMKFTGKIYLDETEKKMFRQFYGNIVDSINIGEFTPKSLKENKKKILILTNQFLSMMHAPTRNVIDYAYTLTEMGYEVFIINTAEVIRKNYLPILEYMQGNYESKWDYVDSFVYKGRELPLFQNQYDMPHIGMIRMMLSFIDNYNPGFVINVGDTHVMADICAKYFKTIHIPCGSQVPEQKYGYFVVPSMPRKELENEINRNYINIKYSFLAKSKDRNYTREEMGFPTNSFIFTIVGNRLDDEITEEFIELLKHIIDKHPSAYFVFMGSYNRYVEMIKKYPVLERHSKYLGFVKDIIGISSICNAYLNPKRNGGASSAADAMMIGLPVITPKYGDVYYQLWLDNGYDTEQETLDIIDKLINDKKFYEEKRMYAKEHIKENFDTKQMMEKIIQFMSNEI